MALTPRELWTAIHGIILGAGFLLAFSGGLAGLWGLRPTWVTPEGNRASLRSMIIGTWAMALLAWGAVVIGTYVIYPWYRATPPPGAAVQLSAYPRSLLLSSAKTAGWHKLGMEWKEHIAWLVPVLATAVAFTVTRQRRALIHDDRMRRLLIFLFAAAFFCAAVAGVFGAFINKAAPVH